MLTVAEFIRVGGGGAGGAGGADGRAPVCMRAALLVNQCGVDWLVFAYVQALEALQQWGGLGCVSELAGGLLGCMWRQHVFFCGE